MISLLIGATILGALHSLIPNHWMPLVLLSKSEKWPKLTTFGVTAAAGLAHTASTILIGLAIGFAGWNLSQKFEIYTQIIAPSILIGLGLIYLILDLAGKGGHSHLRISHESPEREHDHHSHQDQHHHDHEHQHNHSDVPVGGSAKGLIIGSLLVSMFFSPCLEIEAYYLTAAAFGWLGILSVSVIYLVLTVAGMLVLVWLGLRGISRLEWHFLEHHEKLATGAALIVVGTGAFFIKL